MIHHHLMNLICAATFYLTAIGATAQTMPQFIVEKDQNATFERFLLSEGSRVFIVQNPETEFLKAAQQVIIDKVRERGFWVIVDQPEYADFVLHYVSSTNGRMQVGLFIETPEFYQREKDKISFTKVYSNAYKVSSRYSDESVSNNENLASEFYLRLNATIANIAEGRISPDLKRRFTVVESVQSEVSSNDVFTNQNLATQSAQVAGAPLTQFSNPVFGEGYPNPSVLLEGDHYYMTHSTRKNQSNLTVYMSDDLMYWKPVSMVHLPNLGRAWTPDICRVGNYYYIYFTIQRNYVTNQTTNYVVYSKSLYGPWSKPIDLNVSGVDPRHVVDSYNNQRWLIMNGCNMFKLSPDGLSVIGQHKVNDEQSNQNPESLNSSRVKFSLFRPQ